MFFRIRVVCFVASFRKRIFLVVHPIAYSFLSSFYSWRDSTESTVGQADCFAASSGELCSCLNY